MSGGGGPLAPAPFGRPDRPSAWTLFRANSEIYLDAASTNPAYRQIVLIDGPAVLGWDHLSERSDGPTRRSRSTCADAIAEGALDPQPVEPLAHLLSALGAGSAMYVAHAEDPGHGPARDHRVQRALPCRPRRAPPPTAHPVDRTTVPERGRDRRT